MLGRHHLVSLLLFFVSVFSHKGVSIPWSGLKNIQLKPIGTNNNAPPVSAGHVLVQNPLTLGMYCPHYISASEGLNISYFNHSAVKYFLL